MNSRSLELFNEEKLLKGTDVNWNGCFICQNDDHEDLQSPINKKGVRISENSSI